MLVLPAELTHRHATACLRMLVQGLPAESGPDVEVDASALERFDSSALAVLLEFRRAGMTQGKGFRLHKLPAGLASLAHLYGVDGLLLAS